MTELSPPRRPSGVYPVAELLRAGKGKLSAQDLHEIRLLLRGDSVVDWHRLAMRGPEDVRRLLALNCIDIDDPEDCLRLEDLRGEAVRYLTEVLGLRLDEQVAKHLPWVELPLLASSQGKFQRQACVLLKVMHIIYHLDARELLTILSIPDGELFAQVEHGVVKMFDELRSAGVPAVEFAWSRKSKESLVTKLLVKKETSAARVFDRLRFRLVVEDRADLLPTLHVLLHRCIPFNYVVPGQTVNSLVDSSKLPQPDLEVSADSIDPAAFGGNEFSGRDYKVLNFVADLPVRVDNLLREADQENIVGRGKVVFVLAEFQILDQGTANSNEAGENSHTQYKHRQHQRVRERLLREPKQAPPPASEEPGGSSSGSSGSGGSSSGSS